MSTEVEVERLKIDNLSPKSVNTQISSSVAPKLMDVTFAVSDVGCEIDAVNCGLLVE